MKRIAVPLAIGLGAGALLAAAYIALPYAGIHLSDTLIVAIAAALAFSASIAVLAQGEINRPKPKPKPSEVLARPLAQLDHAYVTAFPKRGGADSVRLQINPATDAEILKTFKNLDTADIMLLVKKGPDKAPYNPILIQNIVNGLKGKPGFQHVLLVDEREEYIGYIPGHYARSNFNDIAKIQKYVIEVLDKPETSAILRDIYGLASADCISDEEKVSAAVDRLANGLVRGLVVTHGTRHRKAIGIVYWNDLIKITKEG